jgi:hypothetical protein
VQTDKDDYAPGETVTITGAGFSPNEGVDLLLEEDADIHEPVQWSVTADANGGFVDTSFSPEEHDIGVTFTLTATGQQSTLVARTTFTDGAFALGSNLPVGQLINVGWRMFGSGFAPANTTCSGSPSITGTAIGVNSSSSVLAASPNALRSIEFTAPAVTGYQFQGYSLSSAPATIVDPNAVACFAGTASGSTKYILNYIPGPTQLAFITGPLEGLVGECLGPMTVQSQNSASVALAVTANTTVSLSSDNGGTGAGAFYSDNACSTGTTSVQINAATTNSSDFYYRATGRGDGTHELTGDDTSPNTLTSATQTQTINRAVTSLVYSNEVIVLSGSTLNLRAVLSSAYAGCIAGKTISWRIMPSPLDNSVAFLQLPNSTTDASGVATQSVSTTGWIEGIYDLRAFFPDGDPDCLPIKDDAALAVLTPGNAATGGGFLAGSDVGGGRVNFAFNVRPVPNSDPIAYRGQALIMKTQEWRCKGALAVYGTTADVNIAGGTCDFQIWDPSADGGLGDWIVPAGGEDRPFSIHFVDNGTGRGRNAPPPDQFGFQITGVAPDPSFDLADIKGGNIDVKDSGGSTTTSGGKGKKR